MKIVSSGKVLNSSKLYKKKKRKKLLKFSLFLALLVTSVWSLGYLSRQPDFLISEVVVTGKDIVDRSDMVEKVTTLLDGYYFWLIPRANILVYPRSEIKSILTENFKRLKDVELDVEAESLVISVEERLPRALYCPNALESDGTNCFFLDSEALIFARAPAFSGPSYFIFGTENFITEPIGESLVLPEEFRALSDFIDRLVDLDIRAKALEIADDGYTLLTDKGVRILWRKEFSLENIYTNLSAFLSEESIRSQKDFLDKIRYLDLRVEDKVFYRFRR